MEARSIWEVLAEKPHEKERLMRRIEEFYEELDIAIASELKKGKVKQCDNCGECCDSFGHDFTLWASQWEVVYWIYKVKNDDAYRTNKCYYHIGNLCEAREARLFACRIYYCQWQLADMQDFEMLWREKLIAMHKEEGILWDYGQIIP